MKAQILIGFSAALLCGCSKESPKLSPVVFPAASPDCVALTNLVLQVSNALHEQISSVYLRKPVEYRTNGTEVTIWLDEGPYSMQPFCTYRVLPRFTPLEGAIITGMSNGTYSSLVDYNQEHGISNAPPALRYDPYNPIGSFTAQYIDYVFSHDMNKQLK